MPRLDEEMTRRGLVQSRSQAANLIKLGKVKVGRDNPKKAGTQVKPDDTIKIQDDERYVSRSGFKLASANSAFKIPFAGAVVLDVGSSTGGFTDYSLKNKAKKVIAVDVGTDQMHPSLHGHKQIELHEKTDIRDFKTDQKIDIAVIDVSFISMRAVLPSVKLLSQPNTRILAMLKPQFEAGSNQKHKGIIKNSKMRRTIIKEFDEWVRQRFVVLDSKDSEVSGSKGNTERFYLLKP